MTLGKHSYNNDPALQESLASVALRIGSLLAQILLLLLLSSFPFKFWYFADVRPSFILMAVFYWAIFKPYTLPTSWAFGVGLVMDLLFAGPLGLHALTLVGVQWFTKAQRKFLLGQSFAVLWLCFFLAAAVVYLVQWGVFSLFHLTLVPIKPVIMSALLTGIMFPILSGVFHAFGRVDLRRKV